MGRIPASLIMLAIALLLALLALEPSTAYARAGGGFSMGSRGSRTFVAPPPTRTAPQVSPIQRSVMPPSAAQSGSPVARPGLGQPGFAQSGLSGFAQRNPFLTGFLGGLFGAGIGSMLFGHGLGLGGMGFAGGLGMLLQFALLGAAAWWLYSAFRGRGNNQPVYARAAYAREAYASPTYNVGSQTDAARDPTPSSGFQRRSPDEIGLTETDLNEFERVLGAVQQAWSKGDIAALRRLVTPEMLAYFSEELALNASRGVTDTITDTKLEQADIAETWREHDVDYATVALRFSALDYTTAEDGRITKGSMTTRSEATETWTFMRQRGGGRWLLAAIQQ